MAGILIIGGGITGLSAAYRLQTLAPELDITIIERDNRLGGKIVTDRPGGYIIEGGPDCFLSRKPRGVALCEELNVTDRLQGRNTARASTFVRSGRALHPLPEGLTGMVPTNLDALSRGTLISEEGQARLARERELPPAPGDEDESVAAFVSRRLGREVFERLVEPLMGGIYAGDAAQLSLAATFPQLRQLERQHGSLLTGLLAAPDGASSAAAYPPFVSFRSGMTELVEHLQSRLSCTIRTGAGVTALERVGDAYRVTLDDGTNLEAAAVILTTPAFVSARLLAPIDERLAAAHQAIPYASVATVSLAFDEKTLPGSLDGWGYVIPRVEGTDVLACTWSSSKWEGRSPEGHALLRLYLGRYGGRDVLAESDESLVVMALDEIERTMGITAAPLFHRIYRWPHSMPQYIMGHMERLAQIEERLGHYPGLYLGGAAYRGVGIPDCIRSGEEAALTLLEYIRASNPSLAIHP